MNSHARNFASSPVNCPDVAQNPDEDLTRQVVRLLAALKAQVAGHDGRQRGEQLGERAGITALGGDEHRVEAAGEPVPAIHRP